MRASGSNDVVYENCVVPDDFFTAERSWGEFSEDFLVIGSLGNIGLLGAFLGSPRPPTLMPSSWPPPGRRHRAGA